MLKKAEMYPVVQEDGRALPFLNNLWMEDPFFSSGSWKSTGKHLWTQPGMMDDSLFHSINYDNPQGMLGRGGRALEKEANATKLRKLAGISTPGR